MKLAIGDTIGRFRVEQIVDEEAGVYVGYDEAAHGAVSLRFLPLDAERARGWLVREGRVLFALKHPNVVRTVALETVEGGVVLVGGVDEGTSVAEIAGARDLELRELDELGREIIAGMAAAHEAGVWHRDLTPNHVLLTGPSGARHARIAGFGLEALFLELHGSAPAPTSIPYRAPEVALDPTKLDRLADVFSLGAVLYELVTGMRAFPQPDPDEVVRAMLEGRYKAPRSLAEWIPERIVHAIVGALRADREKRVPDCDTLLRMWKGELDLEALAVQIEAQRSAAAAASSSRAAPEPMSFGAVAGAGVVLTVAVVAGVGWWLHTTTSPAPPPPSARPAQVEAASAGPASPATPIAPEAEPPEAPAGPDAELVIRGDARTAWIEAPFGRRPPGPVPAGDYTVRAVFEGAEAVDAGKVTIAPGEVVVLECSAERKTCARP
ncbi:MAG: serine/threonine protein kinase [Myxococcota bacterium]